MRDEVSSYKMIGDGVASPARNEAYATVARPKEPQGMIVARGRKGFFRHLQNIGPLIDLKRMIPHLSISAVDLTVEMVSQTFAHNRLGKCDAISGPGMTKAVMKLMCESVRELSPIETRHEIWVVRIESDRHAATPDRGARKPIFRYHPARYALDNNIDARHGEIRRETLGDAVVSRVRLGNKAFTPRAKTTLRFKKMQCPAHAGKHIFVKGGGQAQIVLYRTSLDSGVSI